MIPVACCLIRNQEGMILLAQKASGCWEFPGGKQHGDESLYQCAEREILEELGIIIGAHKAFENTIVVGDEQKSFELILVDCEFVSGELALTEHLEVRWVSASELILLDLCLGDRKLWTLNFNHKEH